MAHAVHLRLGPLAFVAAVLVAGAAAGSPVGAQPAAEDPPEVDATFARFRETFQGTWNLAYDVGAGRRIVSRAIERAVGRMNFLIRGFARDALRENTPVDAQLHLRFRDGRVTLRFGDRNTYTTPVGRARRYRTRDGEPMRVVFRFQESGALESVFQADRGTRWYVFASLGDGRMRMDATTNGQMMPAPMRYALEYRR